MTAIEIKAKFSAPIAGAALAFLLAVPAALPAAADCDPASLAQGSYDRESGVFTPGTTARDLDYRIDCAESADDDDSVTLAIAADRLPAGRRAESLFVMRLTGGARVLENNAGGFRYVVIPSAAIETTEAQQHGLSFYDPDGGEHIWAESRATVTARGDAAGGVSVYVSGRGTAAAINRGTITTYGGAVTTGATDATSLGMYAQSAGGNAIAENHGRIETRGVASYGIYANSGGGFGETPLDSGTATATNYGTIVNDGGVHEESRSGRPWRSFGVFVDNHAQAGTARAVNQAGATIQMTGIGGIGLATEATNTAEAVSENRGAITVSGGTYEVTNRGNTNIGQLRESAGVAAWSGGAGRAFAVNHAGGRIDTTGDGSPGLQAFSYGCDRGEARVENRGTVVTRGDRVTAATSRQVTGACPGDSNVTVTSQSWSRGLYAWSQYGPAYALNDVGGVVETHGLNAYAVFAGSSTGSARAVNKGNVRTHTTAAAEGEFPGDRGAHGLVAWSAAANADVENDDTGQVTTKGPWAIGLVAQTDNDGLRTRARAEAVNKGTISTEGRSAIGVIATAWGGGSRDNSNLVTARNEAGARIETTGNGADGLVAAINVIDDAGKSFGAARAENKGTIATSGRGVDLYLSSGVYAGFFNFTDDPIVDAGAATVINSGDVTVSGAGVPGLRARTWGDGTATVEMTGGTVVASAVDDPATADADESGIGIWASTGAEGMAHVTVGGGTVRAPVAVRLEGGTTRLTLRDGAFLEGDVSFGAGADTLETAGYIGGDVSFGAGEDTLIFDVRDGIATIEGTVTGLEDMIKRGTGTARVNDMTFTGSSLVVEEGNISIRNHLNLGPDGTMTVKETSRMTIEIGDLAADRTDHGRVTAGGGVTLEGDDPAIYAAYDPALNAAQKTSAAPVLRAGIAVAGEGTRITTASGADSVALRTASGSGEGETVETVGTVETPEAGGATIRLASDKDLSTALESRPSQQPAMQTPPAERRAPATAAKDDDEKTALAFGGGVLSALALIEFFDLFDVMFGDSAPAADGFAAWAPSTERTSEAGTGIVWWGQAMTGETPVPASAAGALHGLRMGATARLGDGFHLGLSGTPRMAGEIDGSALAGHRYALRGGWESDALFANIDVAQGDYLAQTTFANLDGLGRLSGAFGLRHERTRAEMGARLELAGLRLDPSFSLFAGSLDRAAYTATSAALRSEIPALSQRYDGWKARVSLAPADWLEAGTLRWRPELNLATARIATDGPEGLRVRQADRAGVLSFTTPAVAESLPRTMHAAGAAVSLARAGDWTLRGGYMALVADGEPIHAAAARFRLRF